MTATLRPEVIRRTLNSFFRNLFRGYVYEGGSLRFIINIDPAGAPTKEPSGFLLEKTISAIYTEIPEEVNHGTQIVLNTPEKAHFTKAFAWTWREADAGHVFHLEDDWELRKPTSLSDMLRVLQNEQDLASLRLSAFTADEDRLKNWNRFFPWNGTYFECPEYLKQSCGFCGHPALIRGDFVRRAARLIDPRWNPEKQFHHWNHPLMLHSMRWRYGVWAEPKSRPAIVDIGRQWLKENGIKKVGIKAFFMEWEKEEEVPNA